MEAKKSVIQKKICMLGDFAVGKTSLVRRFVEGKFDDRYLTTIGVKVSRRPVELPDLPPVNLLIWDLAGGEEYTGVQANYLQGSSGALLVCDLSRAGTYATLTPYAQRIKDLNPKSVVIIAGNKVDLVEQRAVEDQQLAELAASLGANWFITSAKTGEGVETAFNLLAAEILDKS